MSHLLNVRVKFYSPENGGRETLPPDLLSSGEYQPHFVLDKIVDDKEVCLDICFISQLGDLIAEDEIVATIRTLAPDDDNSPLIKDTTFKIREDKHIVGEGTVL